MMFFVLQFQPDTQQNSSKSYMTYIHYMTICVRADRPSLATQGAKKRIILENNGGIQQHILVFTNFIYFKILLHIIKPLRNNS